MQTRKVSKNMTYEIWLSDKYGYFDHGIAHMNDGTERPLGGWLHSATYGPDSILIDDTEHLRQGRGALRWFIYTTSMEFYRVATDTPKIVRFHNESGVDLKIDRFGVLRAGESMEIRLR